MKIVQKYQHTVKKQTLDMVIALSNTAIIKMVEADTEEDRIAIANAYRRTLDDMLEIVNM